jgi:hypothetical protein
MTYKVVRVNRRPYRDHDMMCEAGAPMQRFVNRLLSA